MNLVIGRKEMNILDKIMSTSLEVVKLDMEHAMRKK